jgi:hypothetical protein
MLPIIGGPYGRTYGYYTYQQAAPRLPEVKR